MVEIKNLQKSYGSLNVLDDLNMTVNQGEIYGFIGENGAGKTTAMNILTGLISKNSGDIKINGKDVLPGSYCPIAYLPESPSLLNYMNAFEYLEYIAVACNYEGDLETRIREVIHAVGLEKAVKRRLGGYSRGMTQRAAMAAVMLTDYDLAVLDEPTSALDPAGRADMMNLIKNMKEQGKTIIFSTHILSDVERVADRIGILHGGVIKEEGSLSELVSKYAENVIAFELDHSAPPLGEKLSRCEFIGDHRVMGSAYFVKITGDMAQGSKQLFAFLSGEQITVTRYQHQTPSLESIYLKSVR
ncbi:MAG: ABC transporter ATP-binding protein [Oscillospiraceae bacterium]|nr:ABC transporter ATP-binding protein [Oscillospiraceae bacterium]